jgi:cytidylate kinase
VAIITISRGSLSGGRAVAECLAERLGYPNLADEILQEAAAKLGVSEEALRGKLETSPGLWARLKREQDRYLLALQTALAEACVSGDLVYHGLAGQLLLRGVRGVVRVRLIAPLAKRIAALTGGQHRMPAKAAEEFIRNVDQERKRWVRLVYGVDVEDPSLYDLTVNLRSLSLDAACAAIGEAASQPQYEITAEVQAELEAFAIACHQRLEADLSPS